MSLLAQFKGNHCITSLLQQKGGQCKLDGTDTFFTSEMGNAAHQKALFEGVWVEIWDYSVFKEHEESFDVHDVHGQSGCRGRSRGR